MAGVAVGFAPTEQMCERVHQIYRMVRTGLLLSAKREMALLVLLVLPWRASPIDLLVYLKKRSIYSLTLLRRFATRHSMLLKMLLKHVAGATKGGAVGCVRGASICLKPKTI